jgi:hypothetical protein
VVHVVTPLSAWSVRAALVLDHALSPAFDVAKDVPPRKVRAARTKVITMIVAPLGNGPIDVRDRALVLIGSPAHCHTANWSHVTSARRPPPGGYSESGDESAMNPTKRPDSEIRGLLYGLLPNLPGSGVASMD